MKFKLVKTCNACPEQYDVYLGENKIGYIRIRHGLMRVDCYAPSERAIYETSIQGDGTFYDDLERVYYLNKACKALERFMKNEREVSAEPIYDMEDKT